MKTLSLLTCLALSPAITNSAPPVDSDAEIDAATALTAAAFATLTDVLETDSSTKQIHAAEVLIAHGRAPAVHQWFEQSSEVVDDKPIRRVVVWRARARSAPTAAEREMWVNRILALTATPGLPDRVHAIESIAKLGVEPPPELIPVLQHWVAVGPEREQVFVHWALWSVDPPPHPGELLATWLTSTDPITRLRAAYITRWLGAPEPAFDTLVRLADDTEDNDQIAAIIVASAALLQPVPADAPAWRAHLERITQGDDPAATYHALQGLMPSYDQADLARIAHLLQDDAADVRVAAAWTILTVAHPPSSASEPRQLP